MADTFVFGLPSEYFMINAVHKRAMTTLMAGDASLHWPLDFAIEASCSKSMARAATLKLPHAVVQTPVFMPVGTQGTLKGLLPEELKDLGYSMMLSNTYHLGHRPGEKVVENAGGLHKFMNWDRALLTDSGGFQMVSLSELMEVTEQGVRFTSPHTNEPMLMTPEHSIAIQNALGADVMMQLDDVVHSCVTGPRVEEAMERSIRWLDRCIAAHQRKKCQNLFGIVQGGLDLDLRRKCATEMAQRDLPGFAVGGLSGGEAKESFWPAVKASTELLPLNKPRYCMGVGWVLDILVCVALGADMFDCVYPTRTARFGYALYPCPSGQVNLKLKSMAKDFGPIDPNCDCSTCLNYCRSYLSCCVTKDAIGCNLVTIHNLRYMKRIMDGIRQSIIEDRFESAAQQLLNSYYPEGDIPEWVVNALASVNVSIDSRVAAES